MRRSRSGVFMALGFGASAVFFATPIQGQEGTDTLTATLSGVAVVGDGDEDGRGAATFRLSPDMTRLCYDLSVSGIADATAAHVHRGEAGSNGPPAITLSAPRDGTSSDCIDVGAEVIADLLANPGQFYVNVHNPDFPGGAIRGQLGEP